MNICLRNETKIEFIDFVSEKKRVENKSYFENLAPTTKLLTLILEKNYIKQWRA